jgi:predicted DNA-binding protein YlxM (UPF0122 family)
MCTVYNSVEEIGNNGCTYCLLSFASYNDLLSKSCHGLYKYEKKLKIFGDVMKRKHISTNHVSGQRYYKTAQFSQYTLM